MQKLIIIGLILIFSVLAVQDKFFHVDTGDFVGTTKSPVAEQVTGEENLLPTVTRVVDGDTVVVFINGVSEKVRLIGVDTPETVDPRKTVQCFGKEASEFTKSILENKIVTLEADTSQGDRDRYGRLLRYVYLEDGTLVNKKIIELGFAHEYTYRLPYQYQAEFKDAERSARESQKGLWASDVCSLENA